MKKFPGFRGRSSVIRVAAVAAAIAACLSPVASPFWSAPAFADTAVVPLKTLVSIALARNLSLLSAHENIRTAKSGQEIARADFDPALTGNYNNAWSEARKTTAPGVIPNQTTTRSRDYTAKLSKKMPEGPTIALQGEVAPSQTSPAAAQYATDLTLTLTIPLLEGRGKSNAYAGVEKAVRAMRSTDATTRRTLESVIAQVENAYWKLAAAEEQESVSISSLRTAEELLRRNQKLAELQQIAEYDVLTAQSGVATRRATYVDAARSRKDAMESLVFLVYGESAIEEIRQNGFDFRTAVGPVGVQSLPPLNQAESQAIETRLDVQAARYDLEKSDIALSAAKNALLPNVDLTGAVGRGGTEQTGQNKDLNRSVRNALDDREPSWSVALTYSAPLGNRADRARYDAALADREQKRIALVTAQNQARQDVRAAYRAVLAGRERLREAESAADLMGRQLTGEHKRVNLGLADAFRLLQVEENNAQAALTLADARADLARAATALYLATGKIADRYGQ